MKKIIILLFFTCASCILNCASAQITGDTVVCIGTTYMYTANIAGAVAYIWVLPAGWYGLTGQGTSTIAANCNQNIGNICVEGFDAGTNSLGTLCIATQWGGGGSGGWDLQPSSAASCPTQLAMVTPFISPNGTGTGSCPAGCGNGVPVSNLIYGLYDSSVPFPLFYGVVNGTTTLYLPNGNYYVYYVDTTAGADFPDAVEITGGCGSATINNSMFVYSTFPAQPLIIQSPDPACVGDTVLISQIGSVMNNYWATNNGINIINYISSEQLQTVIISDPAQLLYYGIDLIGGCPTQGAYTVNISTACAPPTAGFTAVTNPICPGTCTGFTNLSVNALSYLWNFAGASTIASTDDNPVNICYNTPGSYDVSLIAFNASGADTLLLTNFITVLPYPPPQSIIQSDDSLISNTGFATYQWYYNGTLINGATDYFYLATLNGDYNVICTDANGCEVEAAIFNVVTSVSPFSFGEGAGVRLYPNPVNDKLEIRNWKIETAVEISIYNMVGEKVFSAFDCRLSQDFGIDCRLLPPGMYYLEINSGDKIFRSKFVKQ